MPLHTSVEPLEDNKVRLHISIPAEDFERAIDAAFRKLAHEVRMPGFRPGKAPRRLLEARLGTEVARGQALRDSLPEYYAEAVISESIDVIAAPEIDITAGEESGDVEFDAVVEVRPVVELDGYDGLRVEIPYTPVGDEQVATQVDQLRDRFADLEESSAPLADGHYAEVDIAGSIDGEAVDALTVTDYLYEVGSGNVVEELDAALRGSKPGDILQFGASLDDRFGDHAGDDVEFRVLVKDAKKKVLPELTDDWVSEASEFATVDELRDDVRKRLQLFSVLQGRVAVRDRVIEAAAELVTLDPPTTLVEQEMERRIHDLMHRLEGQRANIQQYLAAIGQEQEEFVDQIRTGSTQAVRADLALRAVVLAEAIEVTDDEVDVEVARIAERLESKPAQVRKDLERRGVLEAVRSDVAKAKAIQFLVDHANVVDEAGAPVDLTLPELAGGASENASDEPAAAEQGEEEPPE